MFKYIYSIWYDREWKANPTFCVSGGVFAQKRRMLACRQCDWHLPCTAQHSITPGSPTAKLQRQPSGIVGNTAGVRRGTVVRWVPLRAKASVWHCAAVHCSWPKDRLGALVVNICSRDRAICLRPSGARRDRTSLLSHQNNAIRGRKQRDPPRFICGVWSR